MTEIFIAGVSMTRFAPQPDESVKSLSAQSVRQCLVDAGAEATQVGAVYFSNAVHRVIENQAVISGQIALQGTGLEGLPMVNVENGSASAGTAFWLARKHLLAGRAELVLAVGTAKTVFENTTLSEVTYEAIKPNLPVKYMDSIREYLRASGQQCEFNENAAEYPHPIHLNALLCRAHMLRFGTTQRQLAVIACKSHANSILNSKCRQHSLISLEECLEAPSLTYPFTAPMLKGSNDGSAAALLATANGLKRLKGSNKAIRVDSCILTSGKPHNWDDFDSHLVSRATSRAYAQAGIGPEDVDIAEIHDETPFTEVLMAELLGFCETGRGGPFAESGASMLNGRLPINPSGGLLSKGHPVGATGLGQIYELVTQLRQKAGHRQVEYAKVAVQVNGGGILDTEEGAAVVTVLSR